jgi:LPS-assembly lipoprotein
MRILRGLTLILSLCAISACGFSLRGSESAALPIASLILSHPAGPYPLRAPLIEALRASNVDIADHNASDLQLVLSAEEQERRTISINTRAGAGQYELTVSIQANLYRAGQHLAGPETLTASGTFYEDTANISGSSSGQELLLSDIRRELASQVIRRLQAVTL